MVTTVHRRGGKKLEYNITASIDPVNQTLAAKARVKAAGSRQPVFCLHKDLKLIAVTGANVESFQLAEETDFPFAPEARAIHLGLNPGPTGEIEFEYQGRLGITSDWEVNRLTPDWIELGLYTPWFPLALPLAAAKFSAAISLPPEYRLIAGGECRRLGGLWRVEQPVPTYDCSFIAAPHFREVRTQVDGAVVTASYSSPTEEESAREFSCRGAAVLAYFSSAFGGTEESEVHIVIAPRQKGGGYARRGLIVFGGSLGVDLADKARIYRYIGHEFAHLWWYKAETTTWEDWLNESLAEFSALMAAREILGDGVFDRLLAERRSKAKDLPPLKGIDRSAEQAHPVLYAKGCVLLADLEGRLGRPEFLVFLRELLRQQVRETSGFLAMLTRIGGKDVATEFAKKLRQ